MSECGHVRVSEEMSKRGMEAWFGELVAAKQQIIVVKGSSSCPFPM